jgi:ABC-type bacteriocin/lantibiotic exporter with double-glycine peptidase domain
MPAPLLPISHCKQRHQSDCLAACAAMVLNYLDWPIPYNQLIERLNITPKVGAPASNIKRLADPNLSVKYGPGTIDDLSQHLAQGIPCITFVNTIHLSYWDEIVRHALVVVGMDDQIIYLNDPFFDKAPQTVSRLEFELAWDEMDNLYAIITTLP